MHSIYALVDPRDETARYIGQSKNPEKRFFQHLALRGRNVKKNQWIHGLLASQLRPNLVILESGLSTQQVYQREAYWTMYYSRTMRHPLTNLERTRL